MLYLPVACPGCLSAGTMLTINRNGNSKKISIEDFVYKFNGGATTFKFPKGGVVSRTWEDIPSKVQFQDEENLVRLIEVDKAWYSGNKITYNLKTKSGKEIQATETHPFKTEDGFVNLKDLSVGDSVFVAIGKSSNGSIKKQYHDTFTKFHPNQRKASSNRFRVPTHRLVIEASLNNLSFEDYLLILLFDSEKAKDLNYLTSEQHVHHKDENHLNNKLENLEVLSKKEHLEEHKDLFAKNVLDQVDLDEIISIKKFGFEDTFDIQVVSEPHNFIANQFVVHNSGKSYVAEKMVEAGIIEADAVVSPDRYREILTGDRANQDVNGAVFKIVDSIVENRIVRDLDVYLDATNLNLKLRSKLLDRLDDLAKGIDGLTILISDAPVALLRKRNTNRAHPVPDHVFERFYSLAHSFEPERIAEEYDAMVMTFDEMLEKCKIEEIIQLDKWMEDVESLDIDALKKEGLI